jgi:hypothetical protein
LVDLGFAAERYRAWIAVEHLPYLRTADAIHAGLVGRPPRVTAAVARLLTTAGGGDALAGA